MTGWQISHPAVGRRLSESISARKRCIVPGFRVYRVLPLGVRGGVILVP